MTYPTDPQQPPPYQPHQPQPDQSQPQPVYAYPAVPVQTGPQNGMAISGLVLGIVATAIAIIPFGIFIIWPASILAIIFGAIGHSKANRGESNMKRAAVAGWVLGIVSMVIAPILWAIFFAAVLGAGAAVGTGV